MTEPPKKAARTEGSAAAAGSRKDKKDKPDDMDLKNGPFSVLQSAMDTNTKVIVRCRFDRMLIGYVRAFDKHFNMLLTEVNEVTQTSTGAAQRVISAIVLRGDSVVFVLKLQPQ